MTATVHRPVAVQIVLVNCGWYTSTKVIYCCSCGRRLAKHGEKTIAHFQPEIVGYARVCRELDAVETQARLETV